MTDQSGESELEDTVDLVYFFVPLPEPLSLPDRAVLEFHVNPSLEDIVTALDADKQTSLDDSRRLISLNFWQTNIEHDDPFGVEAAVSVAVNAFPDMPIRTKNPSTFELPVTVVEAAVQLAPFEGKSPGQDVTSEALDVALDCISAVQRAYSFLTKLMVTPITR